jgi:hypothetical protein
MKGNVSIGFALILIVILALVFGGVFWLMGKRTITEAPVIQTTQPVSNVSQQTEQSASQPDKVVYENKEFGFSLELPVSWEGYRVEQIQGGYKMLLPTRDKEFRDESTMTSDGISYATVAILNLEDVSSWEYRKNTPDCKLHPGSGTLDCPNEKKVIIKTDNTVFSVDLPQAFPVDFGVLLPSELKPQTNMVGAADFYAFADFFKKGFKILDQSVSTTSITIPTQAPDGTVLGKVSFIMPNGWAKTGERVASENTDAPKTIEQKYVGKEGELILTNLYQGGACPKSSDGMTLQGNMKNAVVFDVCHDTQHHQVRFNSVNVTEQGGDIFGEIQFDINVIKTEEQYDFFLKFLTNGVELR